MMTRNKLLRVTVNDAELSAIEKWSRQNGLDREGTAAAVRAMALIVIEGQLKPNPDQVQRSVRRKLVKETEPQ